MLCLQFGVLARLLACKCCAGQVKAGAKTPELGKSDSARKRAHQAAEAAEEVLLCA